MQKFQTNLAALEHVEFVMALMKSAVARGRRARLEVMGKLGVRTRSSARTALAFETKTGKTIYPDSVVEWTTNLGFVEKGLVEVRCRRIAKEWDLLHEMLLAAVDYENTCSDTADDAADAARGEVHG